MCFIKLDRKILEWEWYKNPVTKSVFIHCLLKANWKEGRFEGQVIPRGSFVSSRKTMAAELGFSEQTIRTAINHLISTNELTSKSTNKFTVFTVVKYDLYQDINQQTNQQLTNNQPTTNQQLTTIEEYKEIKNIKENILKEKPKAFKPPTIDEVKAYCKERGNNVDADRFVNFYESKGWMVGKNKMKDWKAAIRSTWEKGDGKNKKEGDEDDWLNIKGMYQ